MIDLIYVHISVDKFSSLASLVYDMSYENGLKFIVSGSWVEVQR